MLHILRSQHVNLHEPSWFEDTDLHFHFWRPLTLTHVYREHNHDESGNESLNNYESVDIATYQRYVPNVSMAWRHHRKQHIWLFLNHSPAYNFTPTVTKFCVMWEGLSLPHDTKFGNCRYKIVDSRSFHSWSLIHGLRWSGLIKVGPAGQNGHHILDGTFRCISRNGKFR